MTRHIIDGYYGIMALDLTNIHPMHHPDMIRHHLEDIIQYKKEQSARRVELRYENCILRVHNELERHKLIVKAREDRKLST